MIYGLYQSAAGLQLNQYRMEVLANNLANASTPGFKHDLTVVRERNVASLENPAEAAMSNRTLDELSGGSLVAPTYTSFEQGPIDHTGRPLDVALTGDGFFTVGDGNDVRYTRDGRFMISDSGELVMVAGNHPVLDEAGQPITVSGQARDKIEITAAGEVKAGDTVLGRIGVVDFEDKTQLRKVGGDLIDALNETPQAANASFRPGFIEGSTVDPMKAMVSMIEVTRAYELNATLIGLADGTLARAVNDIARIR